MELDNRETRICKKCQKTYVLELGFYLHNGAYSHTCKSCEINNRLEIEHKKRNYTFINHLHHEFDDKNIAICERCGIKRIATRIPNKWGFLFDNNGIFQKERIICVTKNKENGQ